VNTACGKIYARIRHAGSRISAGPFATKAEASAWYHAKAAELRGAFVPTRGAA